MSIQLNVRALLVLSASFLLPACALFPNSKPAGTDAGMLVAQDFVNVLQQVEGLKPDATVLDFKQVANAGNTFASSLETTLQKAGYALRAEGADEAKLPVSYSIVRKTDSTTGQMVTYTLSVGEVSMRRSYMPLEGGRVAPLAAMQVKGIDATKLQLNDSIFEVEPKPDPGKGELLAKGLTTDPARTQTLKPPVPTTALPGATEQLEATNTASQIEIPAVARQVEAPVVVSAAELQQATPMANQAAAAQPASVVQANASPGANSGILQAPSRERASQQSLIDIAAPSIAKSTQSNNVFDGLAGLSDKPTRNMRDIGESNFEATLNDFSLVRETILTFGDDSLRLGDLNKTRVQQFVELFAEESDVFSIIGCSHGPTRRDFGQQGLALGRAKRVRDELLFSGVPKERILDEGCWAEESFDERFPRRGVVLSLLRPTA